MVSTLPKVLIRKIPKTRPSSSSQTSLVSPSPTRKSSPILLLSVLDLMYGSQTSSTVRHSQSARTNCLGDRSSSDGRPGHPPVKPEVLDYFLPRYPGEKMGFLRKLRFYLTLLTHIPGMIGCRPGVVDSRATEVISPLLRAAG